MKDQRSLVRGSEQVPLLRQRIGDVLTLAARRWPENLALVSAEQGIRWNYAEFNDRVRRFAAGLLALGLEPGDRLGIWAPNCAEWAIAQFATARVGVILTTINPAYRPGEAEFVLQKVRLKALIVAETFKTSRYCDMVETLVPEMTGADAGCFTSRRLPALRFLIRIGGESARPGWTDFERVGCLAEDSQLANAYEISEKLEADDAINIQFTSGTTGEPKGATLSHANIVNNAYFNGLAMRIEPGDRICIPVPLYHCFGMVLGNLTCVVHGAAMVYPAAGFDPVAVLRAVESERCTALYGVPTMFIAELSHPDFAAFDLSSLRTGCMAGAPCPPELMQAVIDKMHMRHVTIGYGMTETSPLSWQTAADEPMERRVSTVGRIHPHVECKVVDEGGTIVPRGIAGELHTRGYNVMQGYWDEPEQTAATIDEDGWLRTGDQVVIDAEGYARIVGRLKDMIIRGGENIYPREIEDCLFAHPAVEDVAVIGVPDEKYGEQVCACIRLSGEAEADDEAIRQFCRERLAHYKVPRFVFFLDAFPMTVSGKIQKFELKKRVLANFCPRASEGTAPQSGA